MLDLNNGVITISSFLHNIVAMKYSLLETTINHKPCKYQTLDWEEDDIDLTDGFVINNSIISVGQVQNEINTNERSLNFSETKEICISCRGKKPGAVFDKCGHNVICDECVPLFFGPDAVSDECPKCYSTYTNVIVIR